MFPPTVTVTGICMCLTVHICLSQYMDHMDSGNRSWKHLKMLCPAFTHTSFSLHIGVYGTLGFASTNKKTTSCIIFALRGHSVLCFPTISQFKPLDFHNLLCWFLFCSPYLNPISHSLAWIYCCPSLVHCTMLHKLFCKYFSWHQRTELCYPLSSRIHFCSCHA